MTALALQRSLNDIVDEYAKKLESVPQIMADFEKAGDALKTAVTISGVWGETHIDTGSIHESNLKASLLKSAWRHVYNGLNIATIASAKDKRLFEQAMANPAPFTIDNIRATFGDYLTDPRGNILRGVAEVFSDLDPAFKSHDKMRIGVKGLPKRVILSGFNSYSGWGRDKLRDVLNALAQYQRKPLVAYAEIEALLKDEGALLHAWEQRDIMHKDKVNKYPARGVRLKRYANGNGHLYFEPDALRDVNMALAEYYGEVLPDCAEEKPAQKRTGTAVSKDLQYYPTPKEVVDRVLEDIYRLEGAKVLEPSCGCGRIMDALREQGAEVFGIEFDVGRVAQCRAKGHKVMQANFLETVPNPIYDHVVMNPPFYGKHYAQHAEHALKFLKDGGRLTAILPITARYDHGLLQGRWSDLPIGSFRESGTNINTTVLTILK